MSATMFFTWIEHMSAKHNSYSRISWIDMPRVEDAVWGIAPSASQPLAGPWRGCAAQLVPSIAAVGSSAHRIKVIAPQAD